MRAIKLLLLVSLLCILLVQPAAASMVTSSFNNFLYRYSVTPEAGEVLRAFHVYIPAYECDPTHYYDHLLPAGWFFDVVPYGEHCLLTFWTDGDPLPAGVATEFGYTHYCVPCCHSWFVSEPGTSDPNVPVVDDDSNHTDPCNIPPEWADMCGGPGTVLAPSYPVGVPNDVPSWGGIKSLYR